MVIQKWHVSQPYLSHKCDLGEAPYYDASSHKLRFVDILSCKLLIVDLAKGPESLERIDTGIPVSVTTNLEGEDPDEVILVAAKDGVTRFKLQTREHEYIAKFWSEYSDIQDQTRRFRSNDGAVDRQGRFWVSACVDPEAFPVTNAGVLMRLDNDGTLNVALKKAWIPNGISWPVSDNIMYYTDSLQQKVYSFDFDEAKGSISNMRVFFHLDEEGVFPDGHAMDIEGNIWVACWGGAKVIRISPAGMVVGVVRLPTRNVTACAFVGSELFITTARYSEAEKCLPGSDYAGALFKVDVRVRGLPITKARLSMN